jgi:hypothetical protein
LNAKIMLLDFKSRTRLGGIAGFAILLLAAMAATLVCAKFRTSALTRAALELRLEALGAARGASYRSAGSGALDDAGAALGQLSAPWALLLNELEAASHDSEHTVAVLSVEPDQKKGRVRIIAETRDLATALAYIQRLQKSRALRFPILDAHEVRTEDREQPVRFQLSADWRMTS